MGYRVVKKSMTICSTVLIGCQRVTDGRTDGQTDVQTISITCFSIADARKNCPPILMGVCTLPCEMQRTLCDSRFLLHTTRNKLSIIENHHSGENREIVSTRM